jgi:hypothetical protein
MRMNQVIVSALVAIPLLASSAALADRNVFSGPWAGVCGDDVQCTADFEKIGSEYEMKVRVSDGMDDRVTVCEFTATMKPMAFDVLVGDLEGDQVRVAYLRTQDIVISGLPTDECSGAVVNGAYRQFADE